MYNRTQKARFLEELFNKGSYNPATLKNMEVAFGRIEPFEEAAGADCCTMTAEALQDIVEQTAQRAYASRHNFLRVLRKYGQWCLDNDVPGATDGLLHIDIRYAGLDKVRSTMVSGPQHLQRCLDAVFLPESEETIDNVYRAYFWLAFAGIPIEDAISLRTSDFYPTAMSIHCRGRVIRLPVEALDAVRNTATLSSFRYIHPNYVGARRERFDSDQFLRGIKSEATQHSLVQAACRPVTKAYKAGKIDSAFTFRSIRLSGLFYRIFETERSDLRRYAAGATDRLISSVMAEFLVNKSDDTQTVNETGEDYRRWKAAFRT